RAARPDRPRAPPALRRWWERGRTARTGPRRSQPARAGRTTTTARTPGEDPSVRVARADVFPTARADIVPRRRPGAGPPRRPAAAARERSRPSACPGLGDQAELVDARSFQCGDDLHDLPVIGALVTAHVDDLMCFLLHDRRDGGR